jgi:hypothetical protein
LLETQFELRDIYRRHEDPLYEFLGCSTYLPRDEVMKRVKGDEKLLELLTWFGFLGVEEGKQAEAHFSYEVRYNVAKLLAPVKHGRAIFVVHPAFRRALDCTA